MGRQLRVLIVHDRRPLNGPTPKAVVPRRRDASRHSENIPRGLCTTSSCPSRDRRQTASSKAWQSFQINRDSFRQATLEISWRFSQNGYCQGSPFRKEQVAKASTNGRARAQALVWHFSCRIGPVASLQRCLGD